MDGCAGDLSNCLRICPGARLVWMMYDVPADVRNDGSDGCLSSVSRSAAFRSPSCSSWRCPKRRVQALRTSRIAASSSTALGGCSLISLMLGTHRPKATHAALLRRHVGLLAFDLGRVLQSPKTRHDRVCKHRSAGYFSSSIQNRRRAMSVRLSSRVLFSFRRQLPFLGHMRI